MVHPDYIIGAIASLVILALLPVRFMVERAEMRKHQRQAAKRLQSVLAPKKIPPPTMSNEKFAELVTLLASHYDQQETYEAGHPTDGLEYPLQPSRSIDHPIRHDAPYMITKVILPMENDHQKWN
jgi:hypothetical protein